MRLYLINPCNPVVSITNDKSCWNAFRVWKPLSLLVLAGMTPPDWDVTVVDENLGVPDYAAMPRARPRGNHRIHVASEPCLRHRRPSSAAAGMPVVMGGIHATMRTAEASERVDAVVTGEAERASGRKSSRMPRRGCLSGVYAGSLDGSGRNVPPARHDLLAGRYRLGSIQTTRGCPLNCSFCSVTAFNGRRLSPPSH